MIRFVFAAALLLASSAATFADLIIEARETGGDVVFTTSGSLDLTGWDQPFTTNALANISPDTGVINFGALSSPYYTLGSSIPPTSFGSGSGTPASSRSGDPFYFFPGSAFITAAIIVEAGYQFGDPIEATMTFENATIDSLGINPGDTVWSWLAEPVAFDVTPASLAMESITLRAIAIPEPPAFAFLGLIGLVAGGHSWWKRR